MKNVLIMSLCVLSLLGCSRVKSVDYYSKHLKEAHNVYEKCQYPSNTEDAQNCINARKAVEDDDQRQLFKRYFR